MKLLWLGLAERDLERATAYIEAENTSAATKFENRLRKAVEHLAEFPHAGRIGRHPSYREIVLVEYPYVIRYRVVPDAVHILRIFHTSMALVE